MKVMHDGGNEFTSTDFRNFLILNGIKDKQIPRGYPQEQGKVEAYNKIVTAEAITIMLFHSDSVPLLSSTSAEALHSSMNPIETLNVIQGC